MEDTFFVVIPAFNEEKYIGRVIEDVKKYTSNIIVVDDGSVDGTYEKASKHEVCVFRHILNRGVGVATFTGIHAAEQRDAEIVITIDGDGQHSASDIPTIVEPILKGEADVVIGSRFLGDYKGMPLSKMIGNRFLNQLTRLIFRMKSTDTQSGFRAFNRKAVSLIDSRIDGYGFCMEIFHEIKRHNLTFKEVPIRTNYLDRNKGTTAFDGIKIFLNLLTKQF